MSANRGLRWLVGALAALAIAVGVAVERWQAGAARRQSDAASELFFAQRLRDGSNTERAMSEFRGRPVVINFWATWCAPCVEEIPMLSRLHAAQDGRVAFVGLGIDSPGNIVGYNARSKPSYPLIMAGAGGTELARAFGDEQGSLPFTVLLGADGRVLERHLGKLDEATLARWLGEHVKPAGGA